MGLGAFHIFSTKFVGILAAVALLGAATPASADEGIQRITNLGNGDLVAQSKDKPKPRYKAVEEDDEDSGGEYFKGKPFPTSSDLFIGAGLNFFSAFGLQTRFAHRVVEQGFIPEINNSFFLEGGFGLTFYGTKRGEDATGFNFLITGRWDFMMDPMWTFFGNLGLGYNAVSNSRKDDVKGGGLFPAIGVGAIYNLTPEWGLRGDFSYQFLGAGLTHRF